MTNEELNTALYKKMFAEQERFKEWLMHKPPEEILNHAYEYTTREDILLALEYRDLSYEQAQALLSLDSPLDDIFKDFEKIETEHMNTVWECFENRAKIELRKQKEIRETPLYLQTAGYATEHGEQAKFRISHHANIACRDAIEDMISKKYDGSRLDVENIFSEIKDRFGSDRLKYVLAATVQYKSWDGRLTDENKAWAKSVFVADGTTAWNGNRNHEFTLNKIHPVLIDALVTHARKELEKKPSVIEKLQAPAKSSPAKPLPKDKGQER